ncbi:MAG TPA: hypothetical protein VGG28_30240 [Kofleriaceae bacterium]
MIDEPVALSAAAVELAATKSARNRRAVAALPLTVMVLFALALGFARETGLIVMIAVVGVLFPGLVATHFIAGARRLRRIARTARDDASVRWFLADGVVVASRDGMPRAELTFAIERATQKQLTRVPGARLLP